MGYKTILAVMDTAENAHGLGDFVATLAQTYASHVIGLHMETAETAPLVAPMEFPDPVTIQAMQEVAHQETTDVEAIFKAKMAAEQISSEWRTGVSSVGYGSSAAIQSARCADLVIARQSTDSSISDSRLDLDNFLYETGRPILLVPHVLRSPKSVRRVMIAWNGSREATRATFDAMPFLLAAESVEIFSVGAEDNETQSAELPGSEIAATLARHGINVVITSEQHAHTLAPEKAIEQRLSDNSIDLLVMGAYGHSRWWEMLFGGVTRSLLSKMTALTLMSR